MQSSPALSPQDRTDRNASGAPRSKALALAVAAAFALHAGVLVGLAREAPPHAVVPVPVTARLEAVTALPTVPPTTSPEQPVPSSTPAAPQTRPASDRDAEGEEGAGLADAGSIPAGQARGEAPGVEHGDSWRRPPEPAPANDLHPVPALLALPLHGEGALAYGFTINGQPGEAALSFRIEDGRYELTLERRAGDRELPVWRSEGRTGAQGLMPERHAVRRHGRDRELLIFDRARADAAPALLAGPRVWPLPAGTQDRLSWWLQLSALMAAEPDRRLGLVLRVPVAGAQGIHVWDFEVAAREGDRWLLRRELQRGAGRPALQWAVWLDGSRGFLPVDLRFSLDDDEQWALHLLE